MSPPDYLANLIPYQKHHMMTGVASIALAQHYIYTSTSTTSNLTYFLFGNTPIYPQN